MAIPDRALVPLLMTPARHLLLAAFGTDRCELAKEQSQLYNNTVTVATRARYGAQIIDYLDWCDVIGLPLHFRFPIAANIMAVYVCRDLHGYRAGTVEKRTHGLKFWHTVQRMPWDWSAADKTALRKMAKLECLPPLEKRRPVRYPDLLAMHAHHTAADPAHVAVLAAASFALFAMCRPGEVTVRGANMLGDGNARWAHFIDRPRGSDGRPASVELTLPQEKARGNAGFSRIAAAQGNMPTVCPVQAVRRHQSVNALTAGEDPLLVGAFSYRTTTGARRELTDSFFIKTVNAWLHSAGREPVSGHSFRIGGATLFFAAGKALSDIQERGGWGSDAYLVYLRDNYVRQASLFGNLDTEGLSYAG